MQAQLKCSVCPKMAIGKWECESLMQDVKRPYIATSPVLHLRLALWGLDGAGKVFEEGILKKNVVSLSVFILTKKRNL